MALSAGSKVGPYEIPSLLVAGGMYRARDSELGRDLAVKVLPANFSEDADRLRRFKQGAQAAATLNHPNILTIYHIGEHNGAPYIASELLEGESPAPADWAFAETDPRAGIRLFARQMEVG